jgi:hypothetical protein
MRSEAAERLLDQLRTFPGGKMCVACAATVLGMESNSVLNTMRELVAHADIIHGVFRCSVCRGVALVAFHRPFGSR